MAPHAAYVTATVPLALCALCRQVLASSGRSGLIQGFYWSIILMVSVPLLLLAVGGMVVWRRRR